MDMLLLVDVGSRVVHLLTAITLVGGSIYMSFVAAPSLRELGSEVATGVQESLVRRWKWFVHGGIAFLLITGFYNYMRAMGAHNDAGDKIYHAFLGVKMLLAFALMLIASGLVGRSKAFQFMRNARGFWQMILILLAVVIVGLSGFIKTRGIPNAPASIAPATVEEKSATS
ncbi:MAG: hypothetical protein JNL67_11635 [Planctomycetaceae bacterium]|nr:hypothetical protein [Planctomycetaceae bacterium]